MKKTSLFVQYRKGFFFYFFFYGQIQKILTTLHTFTCLGIKLCRWEVIIKISQITCIIRNITEVESNKHHNIFWKGGRERQMISLITTCIITACIITSVESQTVRLEGTSQIYLGQFLPPRALSKLFPKCICQIFCKSIQIEIIWIEASELLYKKFSKVWLWLFDSLVFTHLLSETLQISVWQISDSFTSWDTPSPSKVQAICEFTPLSSKTHSQ